MPAKFSIRTLPIVLDRLAEDYGLDERYRAESGIACLVRTILSQNTSRANSSAGFAKLTDAFDSWDDVAEAPVEAIEACIRVSGLSRTKAPRIRRILRQVRDQRGSIEIEHLAGMDPDAAFDYLMDFDGVGPKTAWCTLLFAFGMDVFPVDTHIDRIAKRLGWIDACVSAERAHELIRPHVPQGRGYDLHVLLIQHGRTTCKARNPRCGVCCLTDLCQWYHRNIRSRLRRE
ncbi:MAG: endonuclease III domain-containing protein [Phycisphaerae bacterium]